MSTPVPRPRRLVPAVVMTVGIVVAVIMGGLGLWQAQVFADQGQNAADLVAAGPVETLDASRQGNDVGALWGHRVQVRGTYVGDQQVLVVAADGSSRLVSALQLPDGRVVAVVRGAGPARTPVPAGEVTQTGVFLPTEAAADHAVPAGTLASVRLQALAQQWPQPLVAGYLTLAEDDARAQGLTPVHAVLPKGDGNLRNGGYALQWWVFAAFALVMSAAVARNYRKRGWQL